MEQDLIAALKVKYGDNPTGASRQHLDFAVSNRERAERLIVAIEEKSRFRFAGARVLDVGTAYAGFPIMAAKHGASAWGVELSPSFYRLGVLNAQGEPGDIHLLLGDFLASPTLQALPRDIHLATCNCLFEHVPDVSRLLHHLHTVLADNGLVLFSIPNGESLRQLLKEEHAFQAGVTLLPPKDWQEVKGIYYRPWSYYLGLFHAFGFRQIHLWKPKPRRLADMQRELTAGYAEVEAGIRASARSAAEINHMLQALNVLKTRALSEEAQQNAESLQWDYLTAYWDGYAVKTAPCAGGLGPLGAAPDASASPSPPTSTLVSLDEPPTCYATHWNLRTTVALTRTPDGLKCEVAPGQDASGSQYGGVSLPVAGLWALRLRLTFLNPQGIAAVFVDGCDAAGQTLLRWEWRVSASASPNPAPQSYVLVPGAPCGPFSAKQCARPEKVERLHVFLRLVPGLHAGFVLHAADFAPA